MTHKDRSALAQNYLLDHSYLSLSRFGSFLIQGLANKLHEALARKWFLQHKCILESAGFGIILSR